MCKNYVPIKHILVIVVVVILVLSEKGHAITQLLRKARCLIPNSSDHISRALLLQQCFSEKYGQGNETTCYNELGCFSMDEPWTSLIRPFPSPYPPEDADTGITLYTRDDPQGHNVTLWPEISLQGTDYKPRRPLTVFLTHGFASNGKAEWLMEMKDAYLERENANVFVVNWEKGASICSYLQAASNTRMVGAELGRFGKYLCKQGQSKYKLHLVGHSLGAHIMSYMAKTLKEVNAKAQIRRITALDPAQPGFEGANKAVRLDKEDAQQVDVIHTDAKPFIPFVGFGMIQPVGHVDFYMNGGATQPGCLSVDGNVTSIIDLAKISVELLSKWVSCSHGRSYEYFTWALKLTNCSMWGRKMSVTENGLKLTTFGTLDIVEPIIKALDDCDDNSCTLLGTNTFSMKARGSFSVTTKGQKPFCEITDQQLYKLKNLLPESFYGVFSGAVDKIKSFTKRTVDRIKQHF